MLIRRALGNGKGGVHQNVHLDAKECTPRLQSGGSRSTFSERRGGDCFQKTHASTEIVLSQIQPFVFDCAVNHGPRRSINFVQSVVNHQAGNEPPLSVDGAMGPNTRRGGEGAQKEMGDAFLKALLSSIIGF